MSGEPKMFRINPENRESEAITEVEFARLGLQERRDIQEWIAANPGILGDDLLIVGKEFSGFDRTNERLDLLGVARDGALVIIELKRDDTGADAHWQAIKYASYFRHATADDIVGMLADYGEMTEREAANRLLKHLQADDFGALNHDQRIILASHRFAPEVTSAVLWLNEKAPNENLITCVQLTPYHDQITRSLYVQASTIIPLPGIDDYVVRVGDGLVERSGGDSAGFGAKLSRRFAHSIQHEATPFLRRVGDLAIDGLSNGIRPDRKSKWAGRHSNPEGRYYHFWHSRPDWGNWRGMSYRVNLWLNDEEDRWSAEVEFWHEGHDLPPDINNIEIHEGARFEPHRIVTSVGTDTLNDDFGNKIAFAVRRFIEEIAPVVSASVEEDNEEEI